MCDGKVKATNEMIEAALEAANAYNYGIEDRVGYGAISAAVEAALKHHHKDCQKILSTHQK